MKTAITICALNKVFICAIACVAFSSLNRNIAVRLGSLYFLQNLFFFRSFSPLVFQTFPFLRFTFFTLLLKFSAFAFSFFLLLYSLFKPFLLTLLFFPFFFFFSFQFFPVTAFDKYYLLSLLALGPV